MKHHVSHLFEGYRVTDANSSDGIVFQLNSRNKMAVMTQLAHFCILSGGFNKNCLRYGIKLDVPLIALLRDVEPIDKSQKCKKHSEGYF